jgi:hypothetical protein
VLLGLAQAEGSTAALPARAIPLNSRRRETGALLPNTAMRFRSVNAVVSVGVVVTSRLSADDVKYHVT